MTAAEVVDLLDGYRRSVRRAGARRGTTVDARATQRRRLHVVTPTTGAGAADAVVIATGAVQRRRTCPALAADAARADRTRSPPLEYRNPDQLGDGDVLVVGASASGVQIADELAAQRPRGDAGRRRARPPAAHLPGPRHPLVDGRASASSTSATTRSTTSTGPGGSRRCSWSAHRSGARSTSTRSPPPASRVVGRLVGVGDRRPVLRLAGQPRGAAPTSSSTACSTASTSTSPSTASAGLGAPPDRPEPTRLPHGADRAAARPGRDRRLGDRLPAVVPVARRRRCSTARARSSTTAACCACPGCTSSGLPFLRRRKSSFLDGVGPDALELCRPPRRPPRPAGGRGLNAAARLVQPERRPMAELPSIRRR